MKPLLSYLLRALLICAALCAVLVAFFRQPSLVLSAADDARKLEFENATLHADTLRSYVTTLTQEFSSRSCESESDAWRVAEYLENKLKQFTPEVTRQEYSVGEQRFANILAEFGPQSPSAETEMIVVGAHYDTYRSLPGADDNASGVAGLLLLAELLSHAAPENKVVLAAYACEEPPHFASKNMGSFVHAASLDAENVKLMMSLEMIGFYTEARGSQKYPVAGMEYVYPDQGNFIAVIGRLQDTEARLVKNAVNRFSTLPAYVLLSPKGIPGVDLSDHRNFWHFNIPALLITDTSYMRNPNYHKVSDTVDTLDYLRMAELVKGIAYYLYE